MTQANQQHRKRKSRFLTAFVVMTMALAPVAVAQGISGDGSGTASGDAGADSTVDGATDAATNASGDAAGDVSGETTGSASGDADSTASTDITGDATGDVTGDATSTIETGGDISSDLELAAETRADAEAEAAAAAALSAQAKAQAEAEAAASGLFGFFDVQGDAYTGSFVDVQLDSDQAAVIDHSVAADGDASIQFFQELSLDGDVKDRYDAAAEAHLWTDAAQLTVSDDAAGTILVQADAATTTTMTLAADAQAEAEGKILWIEAQGQQAAVAILGDGEFQAGSDGAIEAALASGSQLRFEADDGSADWQAEQVAYADGRLGAEASFAAAGNGSANTTITHAEEYSVEVSLIAANEDEVRVEVRSEDPEPRVVRFDIDSELAAAADASSDLEMTMDGQAMTKVDSASDVYATSDEAVYAVVEAEGHTEVVANVDSFSAHELRIAPASAEEPEQVDTPTAGIILTGAALLGLVAIIRRH